MSAIAQVFPGALNKLCYWHTEQNVKAHGKGLPGGVLQGILRNFKAAAYAPTLEVRQIVLPTENVWSTCVKSTGMPASQVEGVWPELRKLVKCKRSCSTWLHQMAHLVFFMCAFFLPPLFISFPHTLRGMSLSQAFVEIKTELLSMLDPESGVYKYMLGEIFNPG